MNGEESATFSSMEAGTVGFNGTPDSGEEDSDSVSLVKASLAWRVNRAPPPGSFSLGHHSAAPDNSILNDWG